MWEISQKMYSFTEITIFDNSPALPESLPIYAANVKRSRQAERSTAFLPLASEAVRLSAEHKLFDVTLCSCYTENNEKKGFFI